MQKEFHSYLHWILRNCSSNLQRNLTHIHTAELRIYLKQNCYGRLKNRQIGKRVEKGGWHFLPNCG